MSTGNIYITNKSYQDFRGDMLVLPASSHYTGCYPESPLDIAGYERQYRRGVNPSHLDGSFKWLLKTVMAEKDSTETRIRQFGRNTGPRYGGKIFSEIPALSVRWPLIYLYTTHACPGFFASLLPASLKEIEAKPNEVNKLFTEGEYSLQATIEPLLRGLIQYKETHPYVDEVGLGPVFVDPLMRYPYTLAGIENLEELQYKIVNLLHRYKLPFNVTWHWQSDD